MRSISAFHEMPLDRIDMYKLQLQLKLKLINFKTYFVVANHGHLPSPTEESAEPQLAICRSSRLPTIFGVGKHRYKTKHLHH